ncbi:MAG: symmetrical bis(5'-nucleosyl)-tetraphosphatase [Pseudomonadota bacterium]|nr:symmetrical bis(5'-nucleosyl)-tetraphosphatase [Pseudomonadota bacterium]
MALFAIGDIQGCYDELRVLLDKMHFDPWQDHVWFVGDLVTRGPRSLETLRFVKKLGDAATVVLGNHDLTAIARHAGAKPVRRGSDTEQLLRAPDIDELIEWLRFRPLLHEHETLGYTLVHAGLAPQWDRDQAHACAREVESVLRAPDYTKFLRHMYGDHPDRWKEDMNGWKRLRFITNALTRIRYCDEKGRMDMGAKGAPGSQRSNLLPWFRVPSRRSRGMKIVFGHWSTLGMVNEPGIMALDTGCVWGGTLTIVRLDQSSPSFTQLPCEGNARPG